MKKLASLVLALVLCAGLALPALAAEGLPPDLEADMAADRGTDPGAGPEAGLGQSRLRNAPGRGGGTARRQLCGRAGGAQLLCGHHGLRRQGDHRRLR